MGRIVIMKEHRLSSRTRRAERIRDAENEEVRTMDPVRSDVREIFAKEQPAEVDRTKVFKGGREGEVWPDEDTTETKSSITIMAQRWKYHRFHIHIGGKRKS